YERSEGRGAQGGTYAAAPRTLTDVSSRGRRGLRSRGSETTREGPKLARRSCTGGKIGVNDWKRAEWSGPAPPKGLHHYAFKLYALDRELGLAKPTKQELEAAMAGHVLAEAKLMGTYQKAKAA